MPRRLETEDVMFYWLLKRVLRRGLDSRRGQWSLLEVEKLARSGTASWLLAQEKARVEYLAAKERYEKRPSWHAFQRVLERLVRLHSTNAVIQSLINEHALEQMQAKGLKKAAHTPPSEERRCA